MRESKAITADEAQYLFMEHVIHLIDYWEKESRAETSKEKLEGLMFSVLVALDGGSMGLPGYEVVPSRGNQAENDIAHAKENGYDYYPKEKIDIVGDGLHEIFHSHLRGEITRPKNLYDFGAFLADEAKKFHHKV